MREGQRAGGRIFGGVWRHWRESKGPPLERRGEERDSGDVRDGGTAEGRREGGTGVMREREERRDGVGSEVTKRWGKGERNGDRVQVRGCARPGSLRGVAYKG